MVAGFRTEQAQAFRGGVDTGIMDPEGMLVKGSGAPLAVTGELLDVVGRCGGYNLSFAMISGMRIFFFILCYYSFFPRAKVSFLL